MLLQVDLLQATLSLMLKIDSMGQTGLILIKSIKGEHFSELVALDSASRVWIKSKNLGSEMNRGFFYARFDADRVALTQRIESFGLLSISSEYFVLKAQIGLKKSVLRNKPK